MRVEALDKSSRLRLLSHGPQTRISENFVEQEFETNEKAALTARFQEQAFELLAAEAKKNGKL